MSHTAVLERAGLPADSLPVPQARTSPISVSTDVSAGEWDGFVRAQPDFTGYHLWQWRQVFERGFGHRPMYFAARRDGRIVGVLPTTMIRSLLFGRVLSSLPYVNYGGVLAEDAAAEAALLECAARTVASERLQYLVLRHRARRFPDLPARDHKVTMLLPLLGSTEKMWDALDRKVRNQVRKAEKSALEVHTGGAELLDGFYRVFARNMRDLGTPVYSRTLFAEMLAAFPEDVKIHVVTKQGETIAGAISYSYGSTIEVPSASSLREHRALCPNHLLYWNVIQSAIARGLTTFDFGRSTPNDGTYQFKEQWGARREQLWWEYALAPGRAMPALDRHDSKFQFTIEAWKRLPVSVATFIGPSIVRAIP
jgi:FemAB-related protein (PEP-CTERM system-associated)